MRILVTGANGQLGLSIRKVASEYPRHEFVYVDLPECDIADVAAVERWVGEYNIDAIVNCAAYTAVDRAESEQADALRVNTIGAGVLADVAARCGIKLVHISTDYVFDAAGGPPLREIDQPNPANVYGRTKLGGELAILKEQPDAVIIRTGWLYSEFGNNFCKTMLRLSETQTEINVVADQHGTPTYATDLARSVMAMLERGVSGVEVFHFSNAGETTWYGFALEIMRLAGRKTVVNPISTADYPTAARRPQYSVLDKTKIEQAGVALRDWRDALRECVGVLHGVDA